VPVIEPCPQEVSTYSDNLLLFRLDAISSFHITKGLRTTLHRSGFPTNTFYFGLFVSSILPIRPIHLIFLQLITPLILRKEYTLLIVLCYFLGASCSSLRCSTQCTYHRLLPAHHWLKTLCWMFNVFAAQRRIFCFQSMFRLFNDVLLYPWPDIIDGYPLMMKSSSVWGVASRWANFHVLRYWARSNMNDYLISLYQASCRKMGFKTKYFQNYSRLRYY